MASAIDPTVFPDNQLVDKADLRNQFLIAKNEITALQAAALGTLAPSAAPPNPSTVGAWTIYVDNADGNKLKAKSSTGVVIILGTP